MAICKIDVGVLVKVLDKDPLVLQEAHIDSSPQDFLDFLYMSPKPILQQNPDRDPTLHQPKASLRQ